MKLCITGVTGFVGKHVALAALNAGHTVTGSLRSTGRADEVRSALQPHLTDPATLDRLSFASLDLTDNTGWTEALAGHDALIHTASPFPIGEPKNPDDLIVPAREGTRRALTAAAEAGITRVILTSSCVAIWEQLRDREATEADWTDPYIPGTGAYARSKTLAERLAWDIAEGHGLALTTINPSVIYGPPLDRHFGSSIGIVKRFLSGKDPMTIDYALGCVDVRDVARMHVIAAERADLAGDRFIANAGTLSFRDQARILKERYPQRKIATRVAPHWMIRLMGLVDPDIRAIVPNLGHAYRASNTKTRDRMGIDFIPPKDALLASAAALTEMRAA